MDDQSRLVGALSAFGVRREIGTIRFDENSVGWDLDRNLPQGIRLLVRDHAREADVHAQIDALTRRLAGSCE